MELDSFVVVRCWGELQPIEVATPFIQLDLILTLDSDVFQVQIFFFVKGILDDFDCINDCLK
jgi:hypothetical protein